MSKKRKYIPKNEAANNAIGFINSLTHTGDYSGKPFKLRKWQEDYIRQLFGTLDKNGRRQYTKSLCLLPRGNGKSELIAGILLYCLVCFPAGGQIFSCASDRNQASLIFNAARQMVEANEILSQICEIVPSQKRIVIPEKHSFYCALSADARRQHGLNPSVVLFDELWNQTNSDLHDAMQTGLAKRENPLFIKITTAGVYDPNSLCYQEFEYAKRVESGEIDDKKYLPLLYYADENNGDEWDDEKVWHRVNPALGDFLNLETLREEAATAKELPSRQLAFKQFHLNMWVSSSERFICPHLWAKNGEYDFDPDELLSRESFWGFDLGETSDITSLCGLFPMDDGTFKVLSFNWCPSDDVVKRSKHDKAPYDIWAKSGDLLTTPGNTTDYDFLLHDIDEICSKYSVRAFAADPFKDTMLCQKLMNDYGYPVEYVRQGFLSLSQPTKRLEKLLLEEKLHHRNNPVLTWCAGNAQAVYDKNQNVRIDREKSTEKIDAVAALVNSLASYMIHCTDDEQESVYESRGIEFF